MCLIAKCCVHQMASNSAHSLWTCLTVFQPVPLIHHQHLPVLWRMDNRCQRCQTGKVGHGCGGKTASSNLGIFPPARLPLLSCCKSPHQLAQVLGLRHSKLVAGEQHMEQHRALQQLTPPPCSSFMVVGSTCHWHWGMATQHQLCALHPRSPAALMVRAPSPCPNNSCSLMVARDSALHKSQGEGDCQAEESSYVLCKLIG